MPRGEPVKVLFRHIRRYTEFAMLLHWLVAGGIAFMYVHGFDMMRIPEGERLQQLNLHRSVGVTVFALVLVRLWWRMRHPPPRVPMSQMLAWVANLVHLLIYALLIVNGIAGTVGWVVSGDPVVFFGMHVADGRAPSPGLSHLCILVGLATARALVVVVLLHVAAVVKHEWLDRDRVLERMLPGPPLLQPMQPTSLLERLREWRRRRREQAAREKMGAPLTRD